MIYFRGNVQGFDDLANKTGNSAWSMDNMLPIFKSLEDYHGYFQNPRTHGKDGKLSVEKSHLHPCTLTLLKAARELGYKIRDPNTYGPITEGMTYKCIGYFLKFEILKIQDLLRWTFS